VSNAAVQWRTLDPPELAAEPDASFGGAIAAIFFAAAFALLPIVFLIVSLAKDTQGTTWVLLMMLRQAFGGADIKSISLAASMVQMLTLLVWAVIFIAVTLARVRSGPTIAAVAFAAAALVGPAGQCVSAIVIIGGTGGIFAAGSQLPHMVLNLVAAVAFWAYMREGRRPNLYFRGRLRVEAVPFGAASA
jgi:hypothetical protein